MFNQVKTSVARLARREDGQGMAEYGLIIVLIAIVVYVVVQLLGGNLSNTFNNIANKMNG